MTTIPTWEEYNAELDHPAERPNEPDPMPTDDEVERSWMPQDMTEALAGNGPPPATYLTRTDNIALIYPGRVHWIQGESESLKSWLLLLGVAQALIDGLNVVWIDFEDDAIGVGARLVGLGVPKDVLLDQQRFAYVQPTDALYDHRNNTALPGAVDLARLLKASTWHLVGIDGVTEAMTVEGLSLLDNADIATWLRVLPKYITSLTGAGVVAIDHVTKSRETQGRFAIGGQHKLAGTTGATYKVTALTGLGRAISQPITGQSLVTIEKDRPGWVRPHQVGDDKRIAILEVTSYPDGGLTARLLPPDQATIMPPWVLCERILQFLTRYDGASKNTIENDIDGRAGTIREAVRWMVDEGWISVSKSGRSHCHSVTTLGAQQMTDRAA